MFARHMQAIFSRHWTATTGEMLAGETWYPEIKETTHDTTGRRAADECYRYACFASVADDDLYPAQFATHFALTCAQKEIIIATPYVIPTPQLLRLLERKARSGVRVILITMGEATDLEQLIRHASHASYGALLEAGGEIYEYAPSLYHRKTMLIDGEVAMLGTVNFDIRSLKLNDEVVVAVQSHLFAKIVRASLEHDRLASKRIKKDPWERRGLMKRIIERMIAPFSEQL